MFARIQSFLRQPRPVRGAVVFLSVFVTVLSVPTRAAQDGRAATPERQLPEVRVNRRVPAVTPPPVAPSFSATPTTREVRQARVFPEALVPVGRAPRADETAALAVAIRAYVARGRAADTEPLTAFIAQHGDSPWTASLLANLATVQRAGGFISRSIDTSIWAWELAKDHPDPDSQAVADFAIAEAVHLASSVGHRRMLEALLKRVGSRDIGGSAGAKIARGRHVLALSGQHPEMAISSGKWAADQMASALGQLDLKTRDISRDYRSEARGMTMAEVQAAAAAAGAPLVAASRTPTARPVVPSIVHFTFGHFVALIAEEDDRFLTIDPALGGRAWITREALRSETSDVALVPAASVKAGWSVAPSASLSALVGHTCYPGYPPDPEPPCCPPKCCGAGGASGGMVTYTLNEATAGLVLRDTPVGYAPALGPATYFTLTYNHRDAFQPQIQPFGNVGPLWSHNWTAYAREEPAFCVSSSCNSDSVWVFLQDGGKEVFYRQNGVFPTDYWRTQAQLVQTSTSPIQYERRLPDGTVEVYGLSDGAPAGHRRVFLTQVTDPQGHSVSLTYDAQLRLVALTDAIGQVTTFSYEWPTDALKLTRVTDPFGRNAVLAYTDTGQLASITDVLGLVSSMTYTTGDFVAGLTTPYGTSTFRHENADEMSWDRWVEATDPLGGTERVEYRWTTTALPATEAVDPVPSGFSVSNQDLNNYVSIVWGKRAWALGPHDLAYATVTRWMLGPALAYGGPPAIPVPHSIKRPLERRVWYRYAGQLATSPDYLSTLGKPAKTGRVLADGTSQVTETTYNTRGRVTSSTDALGRRTSYTYTANGIDLLEVRQTTGSLNDLLTGYASYNTQHLPASVTDAAGEATTFTYNAAGQLLTSTNATSETTTYAYNTDGQLLSVTGPVSGATTSYTYDTFGRVRTVTDSDSGSITTDYDVFDRPTRVTHPDSTYDETTYDRLDAATRRDRLGRVTRTFFDALRRVTGVRDPAGRAITQRWCPCGSLDAIVDANGHATSWERDAANRVTRELRADGTTATDYTYDATGRLATATDPKQQVTTYTYAADDKVLGLTFTNAAITTPAVSYAYAVAYPRMTTMVDGTGTTNYTYQPPGSAGAGQVATVDGPLADDTITFTYDELGRVSGRAINGVGLTQSYDALGRVTTEVNVLGTFSYGYDGVSSRLATVTYPNGQTSAYTYLPTAQDHRLQTIHHKYPGGATLSKFDYTYDAVGNILTWQQQADSTPAIVWEYGYDRADQLTAAIKKTTGGTPTVVQRLYYAYDPAGNRTVEQIEDVATLSSYDALNRLTTQVPGGALQVVGNVNEAATVMVAGRPVLVDAAGRFQGPVSITAGTQTFTVQATDASGNVRSQQYQVSQAGATKTLTYDANGNLGSDGVRTLEWDARNQIAAVTVGTHRTEYTYDGQQRRVRVVEQSGGVTQTQMAVWCGTEACETRNGTEPSATSRYFLRGEQQGTANVFLARDHLRSATEATNNSGGLMTRATYDPWGRRSLVSGTESTSRGFTGHEWSSGANVWLTLYRAYDSALGTWLSQDPIALEGGLNMHSYSSGNPINRRDPLGLDTYTCEKPLSFCNGSTGRRCGFDSPGNMLYHKFVCVSDGKGGYQCGGQDRSGIFVGSPGKPTKDKWPSDSASTCVKVDTRKCVDDCVKERIQDPRRPWYGIPFGTDCQEWTDQVVTTCRLNCSGKS